MHPVSGWVVAVTCKGMYRWVEHTSELELEIEAATAGHTFLRGSAAGCSSLHNAVGGICCPRDFTL